MNVCTIIAKNYVANARVLARSLAATNPGSRLWTLIIDDFSRHIDPTQEPFEVLTPAQVGCEPFLHMALRYSVLELSTAVKPWLLRHLMGETGEPITYLDPDIKVYGPLAKLDSLARTHGVVLTPHNSRPIPPDGRRPSQVDVMIAGVYNLGYVSLAPRPAVDRLLDWWADRLRRDCRVDPIWGYFVDQRWFDLAPAFLDDLAIVREPQYNLAYWNLHERRLERGNDGFLVDGQPLAFFHFSGFDPERPLVLSRHQDRIDVNEAPVLEELLGDYAADVLTQGYAQTRHWPYGYRSLGDGTPIGDELREAFDEYASARGDAVPSPFTVEGVRAFEAWLAEPAPGGPSGISRAAARVYAARPDIRGAFPDPAGADRDGFLRWAAGPGAGEEPLLARAPAEAPPAPPSADNDDRPPAPPTVPLRIAPRGVNVVGDFRAGGATGERARAVVRALDAGGVRLLPVLSRMATPDEHELPFATTGPEEAPFSVNLLCVEPDVLPEFVAEAGPEFFGGRYSVALCFWPLADFPAHWGDRLSLVEEIWTPSEFTGAALQAHTDVPIRVMPFPAVPPPAAPRTRAELGLPAGGLFLTGIDYRQDADRQNTIAVVRAFRDAFDSGDEVSLAVVCARPEVGGSAHDELIAAADGDPRIRFIAESPAGNRLLGLMAVCDCFVSLHRADAFDLDLARAMWLSRPVVATNHPDNGQLLTPANSFLVEQRRVDIGAEHGPYPAGAQWAEPDRVQAAARLREVISDPVSARARGVIAARDVRINNSNERVARFMARRLEAICATGRARRAPDLPTSRSPTLARLPKRVRDDPSPRALGGRGGRVRHHFRNAVLRLMKPYIAHQRAIDSELVAALTELSHSMTQARDQANAERAELLAALRQVQLSTRAETEPTGNETRELGDQSEPPFSARRRLSSS